MYLVLNLVPNSNDVGELWYVEVDFSSNTAKGVKLYSESFAEKKSVYTVFMGTNYVTAHGIQIQQSYTVGSIKVLEESSGGTTTLAKYFGGAFPSIPDTCMKDNTGEALLDIPVYDETI